MNSIVYNEDCLTGMSKYPDKYFDLAVIDPPYGIGINGSENIKRTGGVAKNKNYKAFYGNDSEPASIKFFTELKRISKNQIIWGANHFITRIQMDSSCWLVWDKNNADNHFSDCELAYTSYKTAVRKFKFTWNGMLQENMKNKELRIHPTQKPVALYLWIYSKYLPEGGKVIDTHLGSGSNRIAADKAGNIDFVGFEIDQHYFLEQEKRWKNYKMQLNIFNPGTGETEQQ